MNYFCIILAAFLILFTLIWNVIKDDDNSNKINGTVMIAAALIGILMYGYGYFSSEKNIIVASLRTIFATCAMFAGKESFSAVSNTELFKNQFIVIIFWIVHVAALYTLSNAAIKTFGKKFINELKCRYNIKDTLFIIYSTNDTTMTLGKDIVKNKDLEETGTVLYVDKKIDENLKLKINNQNAIYKETNQPSEIINIIRNKKKVCIYCLQDDQNDNFDFAKKLAKIFNDKDDNKEFFITLLGDENYMGKELHDLGFYKSVFVVNRAELAARVLTKELPTWEVIDFKNGEAKNNFHALIIGYGQTGQAVSKYLTMNGCFFGSKSIIKIIGKDKKQDGVSFIDNIKAGFLFKNEYLFIDDSEIQDVEARSSVVREYIKNNNVNYIVVCTGNEKIDNEIFSMIYSIYDNLSIDIYKNKIRLAICSKSSIKYVAEQEGFNLIKQDIFTLENLNSELIDNDAIRLNGKYSKIDKDDFDAMTNKWNIDPYYNKMSSRAAADFLTYFKENCNGIKYDALDEELRINFGKTEHLRWSAFMYVMGYKAMPLEGKNGFNERCKKERNGELKKGEKAKQNFETKEHVCLIDWDELGKIADGEKYQNNDLENVKYAIDEYKKIYRKNRLLCFWLPDKEYGYFSNWFLSDFEVDGKKFHSGEQWFMYSKAILFKDQKVAYEIYNTYLRKPNDNGIIKSLGKKVSSFNDKVWKKECDKLIYRGLINKFSQNEELKRKLLETGNKYLVEASPYDKIWGIGIKESQKVYDVHNWKGENRLGKILMKIRQELRDKEQNI